MKLVEPSGRCVSELIEPSGMCELKLVDPRGMCVSPATALPLLYHPDLTLTNGSDSSK